MNYNLIGKCISNTKEFTKNSYHRILAKFENVRKTPLEVEIFYSITFLLKIDCLLGFTV